MRSRLLVENGPLRAGLALSAFLVLPSSAGAADPSWNVSRAEVRVICPMTVGGSFEAKTTVLSGKLTLTDPHGSRLSGFITADLASLDTGIGLRNEHMRAEYLQVGKGPHYRKAVLSDIRVGAADLSSLDRHTPFTATLLLHGVARTVSGQADIHREGASLRVEASFPVKLPDFDISKPRYLGVGVRDEVEVKVRLEVTPARVTGASH